MTNTNTTLMIEVNGVQYIDTQNGYYYKLENGKKSRISRKVYDRALAAHIDEETAKRNDEEELVIDVTPQPDKIISDEDGVVVKAIWGTMNYRYEVFVDGEKNDSAFDERVAQERARQIRQQRKSDKEAENAMNEKTTKKPEKTHSGAPVQMGSKTKKDTKKSTGDAKKSKKIPEGGAEFEVGMPPYSETVILTAKQIDFIRHLPDTCFWEHGLESAIWVDCLCDDIKGQFAGKPMTVGAMISTLCEKGLGKRWKEKVNGRKATAFELTEAGKLVAQSLGLH